MTRVLLIADTERVQRIFHLLEEKGVLQLQSASTLPLGEFEITTSPSEFTFVQSRISGFSGDILLRHLDKMLPDGAKLVLLAGDSEDAAQAKRHGRRSLDLSMSDDLLEQTVTALLAGAPLPEVPAPEAPEAAKSAPAKVRTPPPPSALEPEPVGEPAPAEVPAQVPDRELEKPEVQEPVSGALQLSGKSEPLPFEEVMRRAAATIEPLQPGALDVEDRVELGRQGPRPGASDAAEGAAGSRGEKEPDLRSLFAGETVADAIRRAERSKKSRNPYLIIVPVFLLIAIPLISYLAGKGSGPRSETGPVSQQKPAPAAPAAVPPPAAPQVSKAAPAAPAATPAPAAKPEPGPQPQAAPAPRPILKPEAKPGLATLPPMLEGTRLDAEYGKSHPGWVRYIGVRAEYKLFKENNLFRAMQVMALGGGTISDDLFKRVLHEFGGIDSYRVESRDRKGDYLVEQCAAPGNTALTVYRNKDSQKIKALVVYYR